MIDSIAILLSYLAGAFSPTIGVFIIEYIVNKSRGGRRKYIFTIITFLLNIAILWFGNSLKK
jgi:hypothetical protein